MAKLCPLHMDECAEDRCQWWWGDKDKDCAINLITDRLGCIDHSVGRLEP